MENSVNMVYENVDYSILQLNEKYDIREDAKIVGGIVVFDGLQKKSREAVERSEQSTAQNTYATLDVRNPLFSGFSSYQNVNKEIIRYQNYSKSLEFRGFCCCKSPLNNGCED